MVQRQVESRSAPVWSGDSEPRSAAARVGGPREADRLEPESLWAAWQSGAAERRRQGSRHADSFLSCPPVSREAEKVSGVPVSSGGFRSVV